MRNKTNMLPMEVILVGTGDQEVPSGVLVAAGNALNIADGQLAVMSEEHGGTVAHGELIVAGTTSTQVSRVSVIQGTPNSTQINKVSAFGNNHKAFVKSQVIERDKVRSVATTLYAVPTYSARVARGLSGVVVDTRYKMQIGLEGVRTDLVFNVNRDNTTVVQDTPAAAPTNINDYLLQNMALKANRSSQVVGEAVPGVFSAGNKPFFVFGLKVAGGAGTAIGTMTKNTAAFNVAKYTMPNGTTVQVTFTPDETFISTLHEVLTQDSALASATIENLGNVTPGSAATVDAILVVSFDEDQALAFDNIKANKTRVYSFGISGGEAGALTYTTEEVSEAFEGRNTGRQLLLRYKDRAGLQVFNMQNHVIGSEYFIEAPNYIDEDKNYTITVIEHYDTEDTLNNQSQFVKQTVIALEASVTAPTADAATGYTTATDDTATVTDLNATLGAWLSDADDKYSDIRYLGAATKASPFV